MSKVTPIDDEYLFEGNPIISQADLKGILTYVNKQFCDVSGYSAKELIGEPHSIVRHPSIPKSVFAGLWKTISSGQVWNGMVKNLRKDGLYYWVETEILPIKNDENKVTGFISVRRPASRKNINEIAQSYAQLLELEK